MNFKLFEAIDFSSRETIIKKGEILYHGTGESFDIRKTHTSGYDDVFWTTDDLMIARTYIPSKGSYLNTSVDSIIKDEQNEGIRKSLGLTPKIREMAWKKQEEGYKKLIYWENKHKEFQSQYKKFGSKKEFDEDFFNQWIDAENNYKKAQKELKWSEDYLRMFVIYKMKTFGYEPTSLNSYFTHISTDDSGNLLPRKTKHIGSVLKVICNRDFKFYNYAYGKEGDLMDVDYHKVDLFRKIESAGYDGIIINDYAQSDYHGNYGHLGIGFFKSSIKDLTIKKIRNQTHPENKEWKNA